METINIKGTDYTIEEILAKCTKTPLGDGIVYDTNITSGYALHIYIPNNCNAETGTFLYNPGATVEGVFYDINPLKSYIETTNTNTIVVMTEWPEVSETNRTFQIVEELQKYVGASQTENMPIAGFSYHGDVALQQMANRLENNQDLPPQTIALLDVNRSMANPLNEDQIALYGENKTNVIYFSNE